jgi:RNA polymerase sigma-70 factor (ECF subfamily)
MQQYGDRTLRYLRGLVGDSADDVQQELWMTVYRRISELANPRAFRTWLFRATRNRALDQLRREKREREWVDDVSLDDPAAANIAADELAPGDDSLLVALDALPAPQREACLLRYRDDLSYEEIAMVVGCSIGTVRSRLHHAKQRLQQDSALGEQHE